MGTDEDKTTSPMMQFRSSISICYSASTLFFAMCIALTFTSCAPPVRPPNIIYILADDLGSGDLSFGNPSASVQTPNIDRLAEEGMRFTDAHSPSAVCTPTRYGILTGRYAWRSRLKSGVLVGVDSVLIEPDRKTVGHLLQENGYHTAVIGKWHLGLDWSKKAPSKALFEGGNKWATTRTNIDYSRSVTKGAREAGFDYSFVIPSSLDIMPYYYLENNEPVDGEDGFTEGKQQSDHGRGIFWRAGEMSPSFVHEDVLATFTEKAVSYITSRSESRQPFFLYLPLSAPHTPWLPTDSLNGSSNAGTYGDFVQLVDRSVGQILAIVDELEMADNTIVIMTSDNGADWNEQDKENFDHLANGELRGRKADIWEAGHRIPFVARWPGKIPFGSRSDALVSLTDLMATLANLLNADLDENMGEDSMDMLPILLGEPTASSDRKAIVHHSLGGMFAIRRGDWKLILGRGSGGFTAPRRYSPEPGEPTGQLYDLVSDPSETTNLYLERGDLVAELTELLDEYVISGRSNRTETAAQN